MTDPAEEHNTAMPAAPTHYVVHVVDQVNHALTGHDGCIYTSPPQAAAVALELVRILCGCAAPAGVGPWRMAIAGGRRTITLTAASPDGQLVMETS